MSTKPFFQELTMQAKEHALETIGTLLQRSQLTNSDLIWFHSICQVLNVPYSGAVTPASLTGTALIKFKRLRAFVSDRPYPSSPVSIAQLVFTKCGCGEPIIGQEANLAYVQSGRCCVHLDNLASLVDLIAAKEPGDFTAEQCGLTDEGLVLLLNQLRVTNLISGHTMNDAGGVKTYRAPLNADGYAFSALCNRILVKEE